MINQKLLIVHKTWINNLYCQTYTHNIKTIKNNWNVNNILLKLKDNYMDNEEELNKK